MKKGFTLIELLIVVAIIAILAAIAVPNFLEAQIRAKTSRVKADQRSLAAAIESYNVDYDSYPFTSTGDMEGMSRFYNNDNFKIFRATTALSTPVAYISNARVQDPFKPAAVDNRGAINNFINYASSDSSKGPGYNHLTKPYAGNYSESFPTDVWILASAGPDETDEHGVSYYPYSRGWPYDPTNGTVSSGDIFRFGPGGRVPKGYSSDLPINQDLPWTNGDW